MPEESTPSLRDTLSAAIDSASEQTPASAPSEAPSSLGDRSEESASGSAPESTPYLSDSSPPARAPREAKPALEPEAPAHTDKSVAEPRERAQLRADRPPPSWKGESRTEWARLPLSVRQEVLRRERNMDSQLSQYAGLKGFSDEYARMVQPYLPRMQSMGLNPITAANRLFEADRILSSGSKYDRAQYLAKVIRDYDIDLTVLDSVLTGAVTRDQDPQNMIQQMIRQEMQPFYSHMQEQQGQRQAVERQQQARADELVETMATDARYPYYDELRMDMADLIDMAAARGVALTLPQAYARAAAAHPEIGPLVVGEMHKKQMSQTTAEAQRAKAASVSVGGAPTGTPPNGFDPSDLRAALEHAISTTGRR